MKKATIKAVSKSVSKQSDNPPAPAQIAESSPKSYFQTFAYAQSIWARPTPLTLSDIAVIADPAHAEQYFKPEELYTPFQKEALEKLRNTGTEFCLSRRFICESDLTLRLLERVWAGKLAKEFDLYNRLLVDLINDVRRYIKVNELTHFIILPNPAMMGGYLCLEAEIFAKTKNHIIQIVIYARDIDDATGVDTGSGNPTVVYHCWSKPANYCQSIEDMMKHCNHDRMRNKLGNVTAASMFRRGNNPDLWVF